MMDKNKNKTVLLYPASFGDMVLEGVLVGVALAVFAFIAAAVLFGIVGKDGWLMQLGLLAVLILAVIAGVIAVPWWRKYMVNDILRLDTERGVLLHGRWRDGQAQREYPLSMFAAVAAEKVNDDYRGYYGRLWLESADGQNDLVLEENLLPIRNSLNDLDKVQAHIARATGLAKRPIINTEIRAAEETAADPARLQALRPKVLPLWRQAVNLAAAGLWAWLALWLVRKAVGAQEGEIPGLLQGFMVLLALGLLAVAVSDVAAVIRSRRKVEKLKTAWRQPSEAKAALAAARQSASEPQPKLPGRAAPQQADGAEFAVYSLGTLLSRLPFLLFALLMACGGSGFGWQRLFWLMALLSIAGRLANRWHHLRKLRYAAREDELIVYRLHSFKWLPEKRYALSDFCGIYSRVRCNGISVGLSEIWLAGKAGGKNVRLLEADSMMRDNRQTAAKTAREISRVTGLPLLEYVQGEEAT
ncbi:hypothetical protein H9Q10_11005 [Eikenella sp. S3360]|uniref:Uncharacterized protein n=1 Tax=Eikenella glucosivorans TaxID=2766967 RepID=A0ABS0ND46_9NEIS|nr:hypothetical protein [Eikenella glucosivorans]MBH5330191.1 hypothetical protein [Eikenella glucosivorans]